MLLETVLEAMDLESLTGVMHHVYVRIAPNTGGTVPEAMVLEATLPRDLLAMMTRDNLQGASALTFALRHQICYLNVLFHLQSLALRGLAIDFTALTEIFGRDISTDRSKLAVMLDSRHWARADATERPCLPVFGFSRKGVHLVPRKVGDCRAFDAEMLSHCEKAADGIFSRDHEGEEWWSHTGGSQQAEDYRFYASLRHFATDDLRTLTRLASNFWASYQIWKRASQAGNLGGALNLFKITSEKELVALGMKGLRERFCAMAMMPNQDETGVLELKDGYNVLRRRLEYRRA